MSQVEHPEKEVAQNNFVAQQVGRGEERALVFSSRYNVTSE